MSLRKRLDTLEDDRRDHCMRVVAAVIAVLVLEQTIPERRAFALVAGRWLALRARGEDCPERLPQQRDVVEADVVVRIPSGALLATVEDWTLYRRVAVRVGELWKALDGPVVGLEDEHSPEGPP